MEFEEIEGNQQTEQKSQDQNGGYQGMFQQCQGNNNNDFLKKRQKANEENEEFIPEQYGQDTNYEKEFNYMVKEDDEDLFQHSQQNNNNDILQKGEENVGEDGEFVPEQEQDINYEEELSYMVKEKDEDNVQINLEEYLKVRNSL